MEKVKKIFVVVFAFALVLFTICAIGRLVKGTWDVRDWVVKNEVEEEDKDTALIAVSGNGKAMHDGGTYAMPKAMAFVVSEEDLGHTRKVARAATTAGTFTGESGVTLTATLSNKYLNGKYNWTFDFENPESAWAKNKAVSDFFSLTVDETCTDKATIMALAPFGEPITVTATLEGSGKSGTSKIDYLQRLVSCSEEAYLESGDFGEQLVAGVDTDFSVGTVLGELSFNYLNLDFSDDFCDKFRSYLKFDVEVVDNYQFESGSYDGDYYVTDDVLEYSMVIENFDSYSSEQKDAIYYAWWAASNAVSFNGWFSLGLTYSYNGVFVLNMSPDSDARFLLESAIGSTVVPNVYINGNIVL